jgi:hypothetical protein
MTMQRLPLVSEDLFTDTERALYGFARIARAMARGYRDAPRIAALFVFDGAPAGPAPRRTNPVRQTSAERLRRPRVADDRRHGRASEDLVMKY